MRRAFGGAIAWVAMLVFLLVASAQVAWAQAPEVRQLWLRGTQTDSDGTLRLFLAADAGDGSPVLKVDYARFRLLKRSQALPLEGAVKAQAFHSSGIGVAALVAVDISGSMEKALEPLRKTLRQFFDELRPNLDRSALGSVGDNWRLESDFSGDHNVAKRALDRLNLGSQTTALFEAVYEGVQTLSMRGRELPPRRFMVVISDGLNEKRGRTPSECIALAQKANIQVHSLLYLPPNATKSQRQKLLDAKGELEKISKDSGGITYTVESPNEIDSAFRRLRNDLSRELVLEIAGTALPSDGELHRLTLRYDSAEVEFSYRARLVEAVVPPVDPDPVPPPVDNQPEPPPPAPEPIAPPAEQSAFPWEWLAVGLGVALLLGGLLFRAKRQAQQQRQAAEQAQRAALYDKEQEIERLRREGEEAKARAQDEARRAAEAAAKAQQRATLMEGSPGPAPARHTVADSPSPAASGTGRKTEFRSGPGNSGYAQPGVVRWRAVTGLPPGWAMDLPPQGGLVGAAEDAVIRINEQSISSRHASLVAMSGGLGIRDEGSTNGTYIDGVRVGQVPQLLRAGARVRMGSVTLECE